MFIDLLASLSFYIIPFLTGRLFVKKIVRAWIIGALIWFILYFLVAGISWVLKVNAFSEIIRLLALIISAVSIGKIVFEKVREVFKERKIKRPNLGYLPIFSLLFLFTSFVYFFIFYRNTPYPLSMNWDMYEHITLSDLILKGNLSFLTTRITDTFTLNSYSPIFSILLSLPKAVFERSLLGIYWWLGYWHYFLTAIASFLIAERVFRNRALSVMAAIFSSLVFESVVAYTSLFLIPQTLVALLSMFVFWEIKEQGKWMILFSSILIILMHYVLGPLALFCIFTLYLLPKATFLTPKLLNIAIFFSTIVLLASLGAHFIGNWQTLSVEEASHFNFSIAQKWNLLNDWYGFLGIFGLIGYFRILKNKDYTSKIILVFALILLAISLAPLSYFLKFYVLAHYFITLVLVSGLSVFILNLPRVLKIVSLSFITFCLLIVFYKNQLGYKYPLHFDNYSTQVSYGEIEAGKWIGENEKNAMIISDPSLQYILEATSGVNSQGGVYMDTRTRQILSSISYSMDTSYVRNKLLNIKDLLPSEQKNKKTLFVVGGRYFAWQTLPQNEKMSSFYNIWSPQKLTDENETYVDFLSKSTQFKVVYRNSEVVIFEVI